MTGSATALDRVSLPARRALAVSHVTKVFPPRRLFAIAPGQAVLSDVSFAVGCGEIAGLMGPNGAGKTTLLEIVATLIEPTAGAIEVGGRDVTRRPGEARAQLAYSGAAGHGFYSRMPAAWNLEFFGVLNDLAREDARRRARELLALVGLEHAAAVKVETFSEGMRQRLGLARALIADPAVLLLDEPTRSVDPAFRLQLHRSLRRWCRERPERAVLLVTHDLDEAEALCDRVCVLDRGRLVWDGVARGARATAALREAAPVPVLSPAREPRG